MHGRKPQMERFGDLLIGRPLRRPQQNVGTSDPARGRFAFTDHVEQVSLLLGGEVNQVFGGHGDSSYWPPPRVPTATCQNFCSSPLASSPAFVRLSEIPVFFLSLGEGGMACSTGGLSAQ